MDSRVVQNQVHENDEHYPHIDASHQVTHGAEEQNFDHEKKSVLNKVKAKAKKIKDKIKKHGNQVLDRGHENNSEDQNSPEDHDLGEDEEIYEDPLVKETPIGESEDVKAATPTSEQVENLGKSGIDFGGTTTVEEQPRHEANTDEFVFPKASETGSGEKEPGHDAVLGGISSTTEKSETDQNNATNANKTFSVEEPIHDAVFGGISSTTDKSETDQNNATKADKTFSAEEPIHDAVFGGISSTTEKFEIDQNNATEADKTFSVEEKAAQPKGNLERSIGLVEESHIPESRPEAYTPPSYQTKVTDPSGVEKDEIEEITPVEESFAKMNVQDEPKHPPEPNIQPTTVDSEYPHDGSHDHFVPHLSDETQTQNPSAEIHDHFYQENISTDISRNLENPTETGQTFNTIRTGVEEKPLYEVNTDKDVSPEVEEKPLNEVNTDKAVSPENVRASEVDVGEKDDIKDKVVVTNEEQQKSGDTSNMSGSTAQYGKNIANSVKAKLTPVYEKVAGVGSAVKSKVTGTSTVAAGSETTNGVKEQDKGASVKDYLAEKLKPGEEDKALSEVISEALNKPKEDAVKKDERNSDGGDEKMSEESSVKSPGVVNKLKGVVGSWFGKSEEKVAGDEDLSKNTISGAEVEQINQVVGEKSSPIEEQGTR